MLPSVEESRGYDFQDPENADKWRGLFVGPLRKVLEQVHPTLNAEESALQYVESLCLRLLAMLCAAPSPLTVQDVEERVARSFPTPLDRWAVADARDAVAQRRRRSLALPADRLHHALQKEVLQYKIDTSVSVFMAAILEYVSADILKLAGNFVKKISQKSGYETITSSDVKTAMCADKVLMDMFYQDSELFTSAAAAPPPELGRRASLSYAELVRDLLADEKHFLRELHLIIRVFKDELERILHKDSESIALIFGNIVDIYELTTTLLGNLEDAMEMSQDSPTPYIGSCFEELAEVEEFRAYVRYANIVTRKESRDELQRIVADPMLSERLDTAGHGFRLAVKYYLPKLLLAPLAHVFLYHNYVLALLQIAPASDDRESFKQVECNLHPIKKLLLKATANGPKLDTTLRMASRARRQLAIEKCNELARVVDNWDSRDIGQCCNEFIREDTLSKLGPGKRVAERRAFLFDGLLLLCKPVTSLVGVNSGTLVAGGSSQHQLKLKEKLHIRKLELIDRPDTDEGRHLVELCPRVGPGVVLACASCAEKRHWMCDLVMLNTKPMLDRTVDSILLDLERRHPLKLPPASLYRFAVPDSPDNILLEESSRSHDNAPPPLIKGATLLKLVERLTYHIYADLKLVRTFLTTYRSFCSPGELLDLLIERFNIPEPSEVYDQPTQAARSKPRKAITHHDHAEGGECAGSSDAEKLSKNTAREDWKRYRKKFQQPVKFRVINVLRHWVDQHFYDFEREPALLERLRTFLESVDGKPMRKWVQSVLKTLKRRAEQSEAEQAGFGAGAVSHVFNRAPPPVLRHVSEPEKFGWHPLCLHPLELARQLTLLEFQLYRLVRPSELVGAVWTKKDKERTSPNLLRIIKHTTNFTRWMEKWILESDNLEERAGVLCRFLEVAIALRDLNNFNGVLAVVAACGSASVHRLKATFQLLPIRLLRALDEFRELNTDHFRRYQERLRSINPPCVPFFGMYLTNILHIEEGNLDYLPNSELINFSKRRKVAEITGEIQQYQNQPYCLTVEPKTRAFLECLDPFPGQDDHEITNYLYARSLEIEPRQPVKAFLECLDPFPGQDDHEITNYLYARSLEIEPRQPVKAMPKFPRKYPELSLKQVKVSRRAHHDASVSGSNASGDDTLSVSQLSPTSCTTWDGTSIASFQLDEKIHRQDGYVSPRPERSSFSQLSLIDKGLALFDKGKTPNRYKNRVASQLSPTSRTSIASFQLDEKIHRQDGYVSPRPERSSFSQLSLIDKGLALFDKGKTPNRYKNRVASKLSPTSGTTWDGTSIASFQLDEKIHRQDGYVSPRPERSSFSQLSLIDKGLALFDKGKTPNRCTRDEPPSPRDRHSPRHDRQPSLGSVPERKPQALSPRGAIVDAELFYSLGAEHLAGRRGDQERVPPLLPRSSTVQRAPPPRRSDAHTTGNSSPPPSPPERPLPSPKHHDLTRAPAMSPQRSPAPAPPAPATASPLPTADRSSAFSFPSRGAPTPSPPAPPLTPHPGVWCGTPPPLPPRRRRDSAAPTTPSCQQPPAPGGSSPRAPPPLPPRPPPAPELLRPAHSTILQRRHHSMSAAGNVTTNNSTSPAPRLPPKPAGCCVAAGNRR